jgi:hypothetical protein
MMRHFAAQNPSSRKGCRYNSAHLDTATSLYRLMDIRQASK